MIIVLAIAWLLFPSIEINGTEMGFEPGSPDPNLYSTVYSLGAPLHWIELAHDARDSDGLNEWGWRTGSLAGILVHSALIGVPAWVLFQLRRRPVEG